MNRRRTFALVVGVAIVATAGGYAAASRVSSPAEEASRAKPPPQRPVTAPIERRTLTSQVITRGDAVYDDAVDVAVQTSGLETPAIATGQLPAIGDSVDEGNPVLEIAGRPVIALDGELPTYRTLGPGAVGPDVAQLEVALQRLKLDPGTVDDTYDEATADAVAALFARIGYSAPPAASALQTRLAAAQQETDDATEALAAANVALFLASQGPKNSDRVAADAAVNTARRALDAAKKSGVDTDIADASDQLAVATAQRNELREPPNVAAELAAVQVASDRVTRARTDLDAATAAAQTPFPAAELVFIPTLPRRIDAVHVTRGGLVDKAPISVSGATIVIRADLDSADRALVATGKAATISLGETSIEATVTDLIDDPTTGTSKATIELTDPSTEQTEVVRGQNVKVTIPIATTGSDVLAVPLAALSAGPDGTPRVEREKADGSTEQIPVEVGLAADGFAEIDALSTGGVAAKLAAGDLVVVGR